MTKDSGWPADMYKEVNFKMNILYKMEVKSRTLWRIELIALLILVTLLQSITPQTSTTSKFNHYPKSIPFFFSLALSAQL